MQQITKMPSEKQEMTSTATNIPSDMVCGIGFFKPPWIQVMGRMGVFVGTYSVCGLVTSILSMYMTSQITAIERQFGFSSAQSGFLLSCNDIGFLLTTMIFSYIARHVHIPRALWVATLLYGCAGLICSLAYFLSKGHILKQTEMLLVADFGANASMFTNMTVSSQVPMCDINKGNASKCNTDGDPKNIYGIGEPNEFSTIALTLLAVGMIIQGVGKAPRFPFLTTYIDDNVNKKNTAMYMGIISGVGIFGPAIAFSLGGVFSKIHVTLQDVPISPRHPAWIGAWWLGFVVFGLMSFVIALPLVCFPRRMRPKPVRPKNRRDDHHGSAVTSNILGFLVALKRLCTNPVYMLMLFGLCMMLFTVGGTVAFTAKYLETQFFMPAYKANMLMGAMNVFVAAAGSFLGGCLVTKRRLSPSGCIKVILVVFGISILQTGLAFVFGCPNETIVGYNAENFRANVTNSSCSSDCECDENTYYPMCGSDNINYMSPCHAGCITKQGMTIQDCACINDGNGTGTPGLCETQCTMLYPYLIANVVGSFASTFSMMPGYIVTLRSVSDHDKAMAVGFSSLLSTLCGWFAGPVVFGNVIDTACRLWSSSCSGQGACALYDNDDFRVKMNTLCIIPKIIAFFIYICVLFISKNKTDWSGAPDEEIYDHGEVVKAMSDDEASDYKNGISLQNNDAIVRTKTPSQKPLLHTVNSA